MMAMFSTEFWVLFQMMTIVVLLALLVYFIRDSRNVQDDVHQDAADYAEQIVAMMEPLLNEAESAARIFESQIKEKKQLIHDLNEKLDSRIISLNLLLNRADAFLARPINPDMPENVKAETIHDTQEAILDLYRKGLESQAISETLSVPAQEVDLVIALKKKFVSMESDA